MQIEMLPDHSNWHIYTCTFNCRNVRNVFYFFSVIIGKNYKYNVMTFAITSKNARKPNTTAFITDVTRIRSRRTRKLFGK